MRQSLYWVDTGALLTIAYKLADERVLCSDPVIAGCEGHGRAPTSWEVKVF